MRITAMATDIEQYQVLEPDLEDNQGPPDPEERQGVRPIGRIRRLIGGLIVASSLAAGAATTIEHPQEVAIAFTQEAANFVYSNTPIGWAAQGFDAYMTEKAGWDHPTYTGFKSYHSAEQPTPKHALVTNFIFTGLREMHGEEIAREIGYASDHQDPIRYQENGNQPVTPDSMAEQLMKSLEQHPLDTPYIGFTCHSMGGIMLIETLDRLHQMGYELPPIAFIDFFSTPSGMQTARLGGVGNFITRAKIGRSATGDLISSVFSQLQAQSFDPSWWMHDVTNAFDELPKEASPELTNSQMNDLDQINSLRSLIAILRPLKGYISKNTKLRYYGPPNPNSDQVVNDIAAHDQLNFAFHTVFGDTVPYIPSINGHAAMNLGKSPLASRRLQQGEQPSAAMLRNLISGLSPGSLAGIASGQSRS